MKSIDEAKDMIKQAVEAQSNDPTIWILKPTVGEAYMQQSLRWLHAVIEDNDEEAFRNIIAQSRDEDL